MCVYLGWMLTVLHCTRSVRVAFLFVLLLHAYSYALDREIFMLRINPIENFFMVLNFLICEIFNS